MFDDFLSIHKDLILQSFSLFFFLFLSVGIVYLVLQTTVFLLWFITFFYCQVFSFLPISLSIISSYSFTGRKKHISIYIRTFFITHFVNIALFIETLFIYFLSVNRLHSRLLTKIKIAFTCQNNYDAWHNFNEYRCLCWT